jgi:hypothetical protein
MSTEPFPRAFLVSQARRYPRWEAADLYKLLHQASRGSEHAAPSETVAQDRLEREFRDMGPGPAEPLVDPIRADGAIARVHLRPWQEAGLDSGLLLSGFLSTAGAWREAPGELEAALQQAAGLAGELGLAAAAVAGLAMQMKEEGYPPGQHSAAYRLHYRPAYRVVATGFLPTVLTAGIGPAPGGKASL